MIGSDAAFSSIFPRPATASAECDALLISAVRQRRSEVGRPVAIGLCGPQGSGKSTMAARLVSTLTRSGLPAAMLSLDDFYLRRSERSALARRVHPLLMTRGVPGTHDIGLALQSLDALLESEHDAVAAVPMFDKAADDRLPESEWRRIEGPIEVVIFEGWCIGAVPQPESALAQPVNGLERDEDRSGEWRLHVNEQLAGPYRALFDRLDLTILLRAPSFDIIHRWRAEQEAGLARSDRRALPLMSADALRRFIAHYERLTRWMHQTEPAELVVDLDPERLPLGIRTGSRSTPVS